MIATPYPWFKDAWAAIHQNPKLPHALLFKGRKGIGKRTFAMQFAKAYLCHTPLENNLACDTCSSCQWFPSSHPDFKYISPIENEEDDTLVKRKTMRKKNILIHQIRELSEYCELSTHQEKGRRVVLIEPADQLNENASNALLKILEEPPEDTLFILVSSHVQKLIATIRSRCQLLELRGPTLDEASSFLKEQGITESDNLLTFTGGSPFGVIDLEDTQSDKEAIVTLLAQGHQIDVTKISYALLTQGFDWTLNIIQKWIFDLLLHVHTNQGYYFKKEMARINSLAQRLNVEHLLSFSNELNDLKKIASHPINQELQLQNILIKYKQIFEHS